MKNLFICSLGFPKTGYGKEETRIGENERKIWNQQRQVKKERLADCIYKLDPFHRIEANLIYYF